MRIIAGEFGGRRIGAPPGAETRPTSDRVREALFSMLEHEDVLVDARVLDLFAGSGALGLEALSRGAARVDWCDPAPPAVRTLEENLATLGLRGDARCGVHRQAARSFLERQRPTDPAERALLALLDPPYPLTEDELAEVLAALAEGWLAAGAIVVVERSRRSPEPTWPEGLRRFRTKDYGETVLWLAEPELPE